MIKRLALMIPQLRRVRDQLHLVDRLHREAVANLERVTAERDAAYERAAKLEQVAPTGQLADAILALDAAREDLAELDAAYRASVALNTELMARLQPRMLG